jgi:SAM-dependent methyltransferase
VARGGDIRKRLGRRVGLEGLYSFWEPSYLYLHQERERAILRLLGRHGFRPLDDVNVLEVGCGSGTILREFLRFGVQPENAMGVDIDSEAIARARRRAPGVDLRVGDATRLPSPDGSFDLVLAFTLFTSIPDARERAAVATEVRRVLRPDGAVLWYDYWVNPINPETEALGLSEIRRLFGCDPLEARRVTLAAPLARALAPRSWIAASLVSKVPLLRSHWLAVVRPGARRADALPGSDEAAPTA